MSFRQQLIHALVVGALAALGAFFAGRQTAPPAPVPVPPPGVVPPPMPEFDPPNVLPKPIPPRPDPLGAIARITFGNNGCTATVIGPRRDDGRYWVLTANHCIAGQPKSGTMRMRDGRVLPIRVVAANPRADCCWCVTDGSADALPFAMLADHVPAVGSRVWHAGYGVDKPGNREEGTVTTGINPDGQMGMRLSVSSGDSGGGIILADTGEVVSCVCCTSGMARLAQMYGAGVPAIHATRPAMLAAEEWTPLPIPIVPWLGGDGGADRRPAD